MRLKTKIRSRPDKALRRIREISKSINSPGSVKVGLPKGSNDYPDGTSVILVGAVQEFGSPIRGIPQRSYLRSTVVEKRKTYKALFRKLGKQIVQGKIDTDKALQIIGLTVQTDVRAKITDIKEPTLKSREGNPLVDTGHLRQSISFEVIV